MRTYASRCRNKTVDGRSAHGVACVVNPKDRTVSVYGSPVDSQILCEDDQLDGDPLLPGFAFPLKGLFEIPDCDS